VLEVARVPVAVSPDFEGEAHLAALSEPVLLVGRQMLACDDRLELAFHFGRALSFLLPGRAFAASRPARALRELFLAAVLLTDRAASPEATPGLARAVRAVAALPRSIQDELARRAGLVAAARPSLNLSAWIQALARTADRVGLLLCGDAPRAAAASRQLGGESVAGALLDWTTGAEHRAARAALGLSIAV
jgi:hypothetical protein